MTSPDRPLLSVLYYSVHTVSRDSGIVKTAAKLTGRPVYHNTYYIFDPGETSLSALMSSRNSSEVGRFEVSSWGEKRLTGYKKRKLCYNLFPLGVKQASVRLSCENNHNEQRLNKVEILVKAHTARHSKNIQTDKGC